MTAFTPAEDAFVREYWEHYSVSDIARMMGKGDERVRERGRQLGLKPRSALRGQMMSRKPRPPMLKPDAEAPEPVAPPPATKTTAWPDGWRIEPLTRAQLMGRR